MPEIETAVAEKLDAITGDIEVAKIEPNKAKAVVDLVIDTGSKAQIIETLDAIAGVSAGLKSYMADHQKTDFAAQVQLLAALIEQLQNVRTVSEASKK